MTRSSPASIPPGNRKSWLHMAALAGMTRAHRSWPNGQLRPLPASGPHRATASDLDHLSSGRLILGLGIGWDAAALGWGTNEFDRLGLPYPATRERQGALAEAIAIIRGVWGPQPFTFQGATSRVKDAQVIPAPVQGVPPIFIAGAGDRTLRQVAELADACNIGPVVTGGVDTLEQRARSWTCCAATARRLGGPTRTSSVRTSPSG